MGANDLNLHEQAYRSKLPSFSPLRAHSRFQELEAFTIADECIDCYSRSRWHRGGVLDPCAKHSRHRSLLALKSFDKVTKYC